jgi:glyceraldehyde-3-phosphate dehydrogenase/erythrose-4-phosphate dehydrogenase
MPSKKAVNEFKLLNADMVSAVQCTTNGIIQSSRELK